MYGYIVSLIQQTNKSPLGCVEKQFRWNFIPELNFKTSIFNKQKIILKLYFVICLIQKKTLK